MQTRLPTVSGHRRWRDRRRGYWSALLLLEVTFAVGEASAQPVAVAGSSFNSGSAQASWSHTVPAGGPNRYLLVGVSINHTMRTPVVTDITFVTTPSSGMNVVQALSHLGNATSAGQLRVEIWGLAAPATGLGVLTVRLDGPGGFVAGGLSFTGVHQSSSTRPLVSNLGTGVTASLPIPSDTGEVVVSVHASRGVVLPQARAPHVGRWAFEGLVLGAGGTEAGRPGVTVLWDTPAASQPWLLAGLSMLPAATAAIDAGAPDLPPDTLPDSAAPPVDAAVDTAPVPVDAVADAGAPPVDTALDTSSPPVDAAADSAPPPDTAADAAAADVTGATDVAARPEDSASADGPGARSDARYRVGCACSLGARGSEGDSAALLLLLAVLLIARVVRRSPG
jgi:hypothetical protein